MQIEAELFEKRRNIASQKGSVKVTDDGFFRKLLQDFWLDFKVWYLIHSVSSSSFPRTQNETEESSIFKTASLRGCASDNEPLLFNQQEGYLFWYNYFSHNSGNWAVWHLGSAVFIGIVLLGIQKITSAVHTYLAQSPNPEYISSYYDFSKWENQGFPNLWNVFIPILWFYIILHIIAGALYLFFDPLLGPIKTDDDSVRCLDGWKVLGNVVLLSRTLFCLHWNFVPWLAARESLACDRFRLMWLASPWEKNLSISPFSVTLLYWVLDLFLGAGLLSLPCPSIYYHPLIFVSNMVIQYLFVSRCAFSGVDDSTEIVGATLITSFVLNTIIFSDYVSNIFSSYFTLLNSIMLSRVRRDTESFKLMVSSDLRKSLHMVMPFHINDKSKTLKALLSENIRKDLDPFVRKLNLYTDVFDLTHSIMKNEARFDCKLEDIPITELFMKCASGVYSQCNAGGSGYNQREAVVDVRDGTIYALDNIICFDCSDVDGYIVHTSNSVMTHFFKTLLRYLWDLYNDALQNRQLKEFQDWLAKRKTLHRTDSKLRKESMYKRSPDIGGMPTSARMSNNGGPSDKLDSVQPLFTISAAFIASDSVQFLADFQNTIFVDGYYIKFHIACTLCSVPVTAFSADKSDSMQLLSSLAGMSGGFIQQWNATMDVESGKSLVPENAAFEAVLGLSGDPLRSASSVPLTAAAIACFDSANQKLEYAALNNKTDYEMDSSARENSTRRKQSAPETDSFAAFVSRKRHSKKHYLKLTKRNSRGKRNSFLQGGPLQSSIESLAADSEGHDRSRRHGTDSASSKVIFIISDDHTIIRFVEEIGVMSGANKSIVIDLANSLKATSEIVKTPPHLAVVFVHAANICQRLRLEGYRGLIIFVTNTLSGHSIELHSHVNYFLTLPSTSESVSSVVNILKDGNSDAQRIQLSELQWLDASDSSKQNYTDTESVDSDYTSESSIDSDLEFSNFASSLTPRRSQSFFSDDVSEPSYSFVPTLPLDLSKPQDFGDSVSINAESNIRSNEYLTEYRTFQQRQQASVLTAIMRYAVLVHACFSFVYNILSNIASFAMTMLRILYDNTIVIMILHSVTKYVFSSFVFVLSRNNPEASLIQKDYMFDRFHFFYNSIHKPLHEVHNIGGCKDAMYWEALPRAYVRNRDFTSPTQKHTVSASNISIVKTTGDRIWKAYQRFEHWIQLVNASLSHFVATYQRTIRGDHPPIGLYYGHSVNHENFSRRYNANLQLARFYFIPQEHEYFRYPKFSQAMETNFRMWQWPLYSTDRYVSSLQLDVQAIWIMKWLNALVIFGAVVFALFATKLRDPTQFRLSPIWLIAMAGGVLVLGYRQKYSNQKIGAIIYVLIRWLTVVLSIWAIFGVFAYVAFSSRVYLICGAETFEIIKRRLLQLDTPGFLKVLILSCIYSSVLPSCYTWLVACFPSDLGAAVLLTFMGHYLSIFYAAQEAVFEKFFDFKINLPLLASCEAFGFLIILWQGYINRSRIGHQERKHFQALRVYAFQDYFLQRNHQHFTRDIIPLMGKLLSTCENALANCEIPIILRELELQSDSLSYIKDLRMGIATMRNVFLSFDLTQKIGVVTGLLAEGEISPTKANISGYENTKFVLLKQQLSLWISQFHAHSAFQGAVISLEIDPAVNSIRLNDTLLECAFISAFEAALENIFVSQRRDPVRKHYGQMITIRAYPLHDSKSLWKKGLMSSQPGSFLDARTLVVEVLDSGLPHSTLRHVVPTDFSKPAESNDFSFIKGNNNWSLNSGALRAKHANVESSHIKVEFFSRQTHDTVYANASTGCALSDSGDNSANICDRISSRKSGIINPVPSTQNHVSVFQYYLNSEFHMHVFGQLYAQMLVNKILLVADKEARFSVESGTGPDAMYGSKRTFTVPYHLIPSSSVRNEQEVVLSANLISQNVDLLTMQKKNIEAINSWLCASSVLDDSTGMRSYSAYHKHNLQAVAILSANDIGSHVLELELVKHGWKIVPMDIRELSSENHTKPGYLQHILNIQNADCVFVPIGNSTCTSVLRIVGGAGSHAIVVGIHLDVHSGLKSPMNTMGGSQTQPLLDSTVRRENTNHGTRPTIDISSEFAQWTARFHENHNFSGDARYDFTMAMSAVSQSRLEFIAQAVIKAKLGRLLGVSSRDSSLS